MGGTIDSYMKSADHRRGLCVTLGLIWLADIAMVVVLYEEFHHWAGPEIWEPSQILAGLPKFRSDVVDLMLLCILRLLAISTVGVVGVKVGRPRDPKPESENSVEPLLAPSGSINNSGTTSSTTGAADGVKVEEMRRHNSQKEAETRRNIALTTLFLVSTIAQIFVGVKCVSFSDLTNLQGWLMGLSVLWINLEAWLVKNLVNTLTKEEGHLCPAFHPHRLFLVTGISCHNCDLCGIPCKSAYRCQMCDFDACAACFNKKDKSTSEGMLRSDKGMKAEQEMSNTAYLRRAVALVRPHLFLFMMALGCLALNSVANLLLPNFQGTILDKVIERNHDEFKTNILQYLVLSIAMGFFGSIRGICLNIVARRMAMGTRNALFRAIMVQDIAFFDGMKSGDLTSRLSGDVSAMVQPCYSALTTLLSNGILLVGGIVMCFITSWRLSMLAYTTVLPIMHVTEWYATWSRKLNRDIWQALGEANAHATEALANVRTVRAFSTEAIEVGKYVERTDEALRKGIKDAIGGAGTYAFNNYLDLGAGVLILWYGGSIAMEHLHHEQSLTVGKLITYQLYWNMINDSYKALNNILTSFTRAAGAAQRVLSLIDLEPAINVEAGHPVPDNLHGEIRFEEVDFHYQMCPNQQVLNKLNLQVEGGKVTALVGKSGGGKSTIVHMILRFYDPRHGRITLDGMDLREYSLRSFHNQVGVVAQDTQLFANTIEENIAYGVEHYTEEELHEAARLASAHDFIESFEDGYRTRVGERGVRLSGGQKQRIAIARIMLRQPKLLLLDEATSALDSESEGKVQKALDSLIWKGGHTVLLVAHRLSTVVNADRIAVVQEGAILEQGTHQTLLAQEGSMYARLVQKQVQRQQEQLASDEAAAGGALDNIDGLLAPNPPQAQR